MKILNNLSIQTKIMLITGLCLLLTTGSLIAYIGIEGYNNNIRQTEQLLQEKASQHANSINTDVETALQLARTTADVIQSVYEERSSMSYSRAQVANLTRSTLDRSAEQINTYVAFEPDAFDGMDGFFKGDRNLYHDPDGRFVIWWSKTADGKAELQKIEADYQTETTYEYYSCPKTTLKECVTAPYLFPWNGKDVLLVTASVPIISNGKFLGIVSVDFIGDQFQRVMQSWSEQDKGIEMLLFASDGTIVGSNQKPEMVGKPIKEFDPLLEKDLDLLKTGKTVLSHDAEKISVIQPTLFGESVNNWALKLSMPDSTARGQALGSIMGMLLIGLALLLVAMLVMWFASRSISEPIRQMTALADRIATGDLSLNLSSQRNDEVGHLEKAFQKMIHYLSNNAQSARLIAGGNLKLDVTPLSGKDEFGTAFSEMANNMRRMVGGIAISGLEISDSSRHLAGVSEQSSHVTQQITATIQQMTIGVQNQSTSTNQAAALVEELTRAINGVAKGAEEQSLAVNKMSQSTLDINHAIQQVAKSAETVSKGAGMAASAAQSGVESVEKTLVGMQSIKEKVSISSRKVEDMGKRSDQIGVILETIQDLASQTNMLALNAAIEAARAGEHGKGFAVVADEVRKLAERSASATKEIAELVKNIQSGVAEAVSAMNDGAREVETGVNQAGEAKNVLSHILTSVESVNQQAGETSRTVEKMLSNANNLLNAVDSISAIIEENTAATEEMSASSNQVLEVIEGIASISEENSASTEEVAASTEEMNSQIKDLSISAQNMANLANELKETISKFSI